MESILCFLKQNIVGIIIGIVTGAISSFGIWWLISRWLVPKIKFSEQISKTTQNGKTIYKFKFENAGRRKLLDLQLNIRFRVKGLENDSSWKAVSIPFTKDKNEQIPVLSPIKQRGIRELRELLIFDAKFNQPCFPENIITKFENESLTLEELFELGTEAQLQIHIFCFDGYSGTRKGLTSKTYGKKDITEGKFSKDSLDIAKK